jgi:hypothetical protein
MWRRVGLLERDVPPKRRSFFGILRGIVVIMNDKCRQIGMGSATMYFQSKLLIPVAELKQLTQKTKP